MNGLLNADNEYILNIAIQQSWRTKKYSYKNRARLDHGFLYLLKGHITYTFEGDSIALNEGDVIYLPKGSYYEAEFDVSRGEVKSYLINFDVLNNDNFGEIKNPSHYYRDEAKLIAGHFKELIDSFNSVGKCFLTKSLFFRLLHVLFLIKETNDINNRDRDVDKGARLLRDRYDMSVGDIAKELHLSRSAFQKRFTENFGISPVKYRAMKRIEMAKNYLDSTDMPIKEIAETLGFYDLSYFYKVFEGFYGVSPKKYRDGVKRYM